MDETFMASMVALREACGFAFPVTSGYRCAKYNKDVGGSEFSAHPQGVALDINLWGSKVNTILSIARHHGMTGIGLHQQGDSSDRFIHLDQAISIPSRPRPWVWTY